MNTEYILKWSRLVWFFVALLAVTGVQAIVHDVILSTHTVWEGTCLVERWEGDNRNNILKAHILCNNKDVELRNKKTLAHFLNTKDAVLACKVAENDDVECEVVVPEDGDDNEGAESTNAG